jgi:death-on-curing protein
MIQFEWITRDECLAIHEMMLANYGGLAGVRDSGLLESALAAPRHLSSYGSPSIPDLAAAYAYGIVKNHPFLDGNKRTGFMLAATFLEVNGFTFNATEESVVEQTLGLAAGAIGKAAYAIWLTKNSTKD